MADQWYYANEQEKLGPFSSAQLKELALIGQLAPATDTELPDLSGPLTVRIFAVAHGPRDALASRTAVARVGPRLPNGYSLLAWDSEDE